MRLNFSLLRATILFSSILDLNSPVIFFSFFLLDFFLPKAYNVVLLSYCNILYIFYNHFCVIYNKMFYDVQFVVQSKRLWLKYNVGQTCIYLAVVFSSLMEIEQFLKQ